MKARFKIEGLDCANCAAELENEIKNIDGIENININFLTQKMEFEYDDMKKDVIIKEVKKIIKKEEPDVTVEEI